MYLLLRLMNPVLALVIYPTGSNVSYSPAYVLSLTASALVNVT